MPDDSSHNTPVKEDGGGATDRPAKRADALASLGRTLSGGKASGGRDGGSPASFLHAPARDPLLATPPPRPSAASDLDTSPAEPQPERNTATADTAPDLADALEDVETSEPIDTVPVDVAPAVVSDIGQAATVTGQASDVVDVAAAARASSDTHTSDTAVRGNGATTTSPGIEDEDDGEDLTGTLLSNRYRLDERVGAGAMGAVYRATHTLMRKRCAIKVLHPDIARDEEIKQRFMREAQAAAHIEHPNVCAATDFGRTDGGMLFLVMEYLEGGTLEAILERETRLPPLRVVDIMGQMASALVRAHALEIVHRDLKPENVFLVERDGMPESQVKIVDFGIARVYLELGEEDESGTRLTQAGMVYGTPHYLSPEQAAGELVTPQADLYALGVMAYEMLTGKRPFEGTLGQLLAMHMTRKPPSFAEAAPGIAIPASLERVVMKLLEKMPADRTASATALLGQLTEVRRELRGGPPALRNPNAAIQPTLQGAAPGQRGPDARQVAGEIWDKIREVSAVAWHKGREIGADLLARGKRGEPAVLVGAGVVFMLFVIVITVALLSGGDDDAGESTGSDTEVTAEDGASDEGDEPTRAPRGLGVANKIGMARLSADPAIAEALDLIQKGNAAAGLGRLQAQRSRFEGDADFLVLLADAHARAGQEERAMIILGELIDQDEAWLDNPVVADRVLEVFGMERRNDAAPAKEILMRHMNDRILQGLYKMALEGGVGTFKNRRKRIEQVLEHHDAIDDMPDWLRLSFQLRLNDRTGCYTRKDHVQAIRDLGDPRALPTVRLFYEDLRNNDCTGMPELLEETVYLLQAAETP